MLLYCFLYCWFYVHTHTPWRAPSCAAVCLCLAACLLGSVLVKRKGLFGPTGLHTCTTVCANPSNSVDGAVTGTASGKLLVWRGRNVMRVLNAHDSAVSVLKSIPGVGIVSGGTDSRIRIWFADVTPGTYSPSVATHQSCRNAPIHCTASHGLACRDSLVLLQVLCLT